MGNENRSFVEYASIILFALIIGYFLIITNPPADLLQYDENLQTAVTRPLQGNEITMHAGSISTFLFIFALICIFIGFVTSSVLMEHFFVERRGWMSKVYIVPFTISILSFIVLGSVLRPYYGHDLSYMAYWIGWAAFLTGLVLNFPAQARAIAVPVALVMWIVAFLAITLIIEVHLHWVIWAIMLTIVAMSALDSLYKHLKSK
jgi:hypothetical protein